MRGGGAHMFQQRWALKFTAWLWLLGGVIHGPLSDSRPLSGCHLSSVLEAGGVLHSATT